MHRVLLSALFAAFTLLGAGEAFAYTITLFPDGAWTYLRSGASDGTYVESQLSPLALPYVNSHVQTASGNSSTTYYDLSNDVFDITFDHVREGTLDHYAVSSAYIYFSVDEDVNFVLEGTYSLDSSAGAIYQLVELVDETGSVVHFRNRQESRATAGESFTLGLEEGDYDNLLLGSLTGTLTAGQRYRFHYVYSITTLPSADSGATATGGLTLSFSPIPEPSTALLFGAGLIGLAARRSVKQRGARAPRRRSSAR